MKNRHSIRRSAAAAVLATGIAGGMLASAGAAQAAAPAYASQHHSVEGRVVSRVPLKVHYGPGTSHWVTGTVSNRMHVWITCKVTGTRVGTNDRWYKLTDGQGWVSAYYVNNYRHVRWCDS